MSKRTMLRNQIHGQLAWRLIEMLESPAYSVLSHSAHRVLARIEIELAHHGGGDNGKLPVTFDDFEHYGIHRHAIAPAVRELEALKFIEITERGRAGNAEYRQPHKYRLTYRHVGRANPTDEWRQIKTIEQAVEIVRAVRGKTGRIDAVCTNPPYGIQGRLAGQFIAHALELVPVVAMLLRVDFDSGKTRVGLFRDCKSFARKIVLLDRIVWFGEGAPSDNHAWYIWDAQRYRGPPTFEYASKNDSVRQSPIVREAAP
jgi:hypothetical protein